MLVFGSVAWSVLGFGTALGYGFTGKKLDLIFWVLVGPTYISSFLLEKVIWNPLHNSLVSLKYELDFLIPFSGVPGLIILSALIVLFIKKLWGRKTAFLFSIIFGLLPIIAFALIYLLSLPASVKRSKRRSELQTQQQKQVVEIKSKLPIKEPTYIPDFLKKVGEHPSNSGNGITFEYQGTGIKYPSCFTITVILGQAKSPTTLLSSERFIDIDGTKALLHIEKDRSGNTYPYNLLFEHSGFTYGIWYSHEGSCSELPLLTEEELLKIVRSIIK